VDRAFELELVLDLEGGAGSLLVEDVEEAVVLQDVGGVLEVAELP